MELQIHTVVTSTSFHLEIQKINFGFTVAYHNEKLLNHLNVLETLFFYCPLCNLMNCICTSGSHLIMRKNMVQIVLTGESEISFDIKISTFLD